MLNKEVVQEFFAEAPHRGRDGRFCQLPLVAELFLASARRDGLHRTFPEGQEPLVSSNPKFLYGREGYSIRKEIIFKK